MNEKPELKIAKVADMAEALVNLLTGAHFSVIEVSPEVLKLVFPTREVREQIGGMIGYGYVAYPEQDDVDGPIVLFCTKRYETVLRISGILFSINEVTKEKVPS